MATCYNLLAGNRTMEQKKEVLEIRCSLSEFKWQSGNIRHDGKESRVTRRGYVTSLNVI